MKEKKSLLVRNTLVYALGDIIPRVFSLITFPILTSYLNPSEYGIINYVGTVNTFLMIMGILSLNTYFLVHYYNTEGKEAKKKLLGNLDLFIIIFNLLLTVLLYIFGPIIMEGIDSDVAFYPYMAIGLATSFFNVFKYLPSALFRLLERPLPLSLLNISSGILSLVGSLVAVVFIQADASSVLWANLLTAFIFAIIFLVITNKNAIWNINVVQIRNALKFSLPLVPGSIAFYLYNTFDRILMERELTLSDVGIYSTAATFALLLNIVSYGAYQAFEPYFFKNFGKVDFQEKFTTVRNVLMFVCLSGAMALSALGEEFFRLFTAESYHICFIYVPLITLGAVAAAMGRMYTTIVVALGKTKTVASVTIVGACFSVSFNYIFLRYLGIWASCLSYLLTFSLVLFLNMHYSKIRISHVRPMLSCTIFAFATFLMTYFMHIDNLLVAISLKSILVVFVILLFCAVLNVNVKQIMRQIF